MAPGTSVCLVDDDHSNLSAMKLILRGMGIVKIESFTDAREAWTYIRDAAPSIVVSDWNMDPMNGLELLTLVRGSQTTRHIPFIMVTANTSENYWRQAIEAGVSELLFKPFGLNAFRSAIEIALERHADAGEQTIRNHCLDTFTRPQAVQAC
jgi:two-component system, chemotaxis family, chemotaxis protein CheY